jgi:CRISPR-associated protein Cas1
MNTLLLSGYGINMRVDGGRLHIKDGHDKDKPDPREYIFKPKFIDLDNIVLYGHSGNITLDAIKWLTKQNVQITVLNWDGRLLTTIMPPESKQSITRMAQYRAFENGQRLGIAKKIIDAKIKNSIAVLTWLGQRYEEVADSKEQIMRDIQVNWSQLSKAATIKQVMGIEGIVAKIYWDTISKVIDCRLEFDGRVYGKTFRPMGAVDPVNALFNYGYSILESHCWKALNSNGLDPYVGFLHQMASGNAALVYDLQEPFRWLVDVAVIIGLEKKMFDKKDFIRTENYNIRLRPGGAEKLIREVVEQISRKVPYQKASYEWSYVISLKARELAHYITLKRKSIDLANPEANLKRVDNSSLREKILNTRYSEWEKMGHSKGTLHQLKKKASGEAPFKLYGRLKERLMVDG